MTLDALDTLFPISVTFVKGEQPQDTKLTGFASQTSAALDKIRTALGDIWGENFSENKLYVQTQRPAHIANLTRLIGPASALNPISPSALCTMSATLTVTLDKSTIPSNVNKFNLSKDCLVNPPLTQTGTYPDGYVVDYSLISTALTAVNAGVFADPKTTLIDVVNAGDYYIDNNGTVYTYTPTGTYTGTTTFETVMYPDFYANANMNVIPDMNQSTSDGLCEILDYNSATTPAYTIPADKYVLRFPLIKKFFDKNAVNSPRFPGDYAGTASETFYPTIPYALLDSTGMNLGTTGEIPDGFMYVWDETAKTIVPGLTFTRSNITGTESGRNLNGADCIIVSGGTLTVGSTKYRIITVGTTITETLGALVYRFNKHSHDRYGSGGPISHSNLLDSSISPAIVTTIWSGKTVSDSPSLIFGNDHPQYLMRYGHISSGESTALCNNAMLGDLFLAANHTDYTSGLYTSIIQDSFKIIFGDSANYIYYKTTTGKITVTSTNGLRVEGNIHISENKKLLLGDTTGIDGANPRGELDSASTVITLKSNHGYLNLDGYNRVYFKINGTTMFHATSGLFNIASSVCKINGNLTPNGSGWCLGEDTTNKWNVIYGNQIQVNSVNGDLISTNGIGSLGSYSIPWASLHVTDIYSYNNVCRIHLSSSNSIDLLGRKMNLPSYYGFPTLSQGVVDGDMFYNTKTKFVYIARWINNGGWHLEWYVLQCVYAEDVSA